MRFALLIALCLGIARAEIPGAFSWQIVPNHSVSLHGPTGVLARLLLNPPNADPHFDVLATGDGRNLVWVGPPDHVWHYGHWFSWKMINGVNFWETDPKTGSSAGWEESPGKPIIQIIDNQATISYVRQYRLKPENAPVLKDFIVITITAPSQGIGKLGPKIHWTIDTTALAKVTLDRTPLPNEPGGKPHGGYGGLSWRGAKELTDVHFADSSGRKDMEIHRQQARWVTVLGMMEGSQAGLTIEVPKEQSWFIVQTPQQPFWYMNPALLQPKPIELEAGASFTHEYQITPHDGSYVPGK